MTAPFVRCVASVFLFGAVTVAAPASGLTAWPVHLTSPPSPDLSMPATGASVPAAPAGIERVTAGDMIVDWLDGAPAGADGLLSSSGAPVELTVEDGEDGGHGPDAVGDGRHEGAADDDHADGSQQYAGAGGGYALFSTTARWLGDGYTIRLTGSDRRIEQYRQQISAAARAASTTTGLPIRVAAAFGGPVDPARGEIAVVLGSGPCGAGSIGCGGPALTSRELVSGRIWIHPAGLDLTPGQSANLAAHELGHALGLQHFDGSWTDGRQVMYPILSGTTSFRSGDNAGLRRVAGLDDRPAGTVTARSYAAGRAHVTGTVSSGSRVRISAGPVSAEVGVRNGRFAGSIPLPAGTHLVCASSLDPAPLFRPELGCAPLHAPGAPIGHLDALAGSMTAVTVRGWALDPQTADAVRVQISRNGTLVATVRADEDRDDLGSAAHHYGRTHGFDVDILPEPGRNRVCVRILGVGGGGDTDAGCADIDHTTSIDPPSAVPNGQDDPAGSEPPVVPAIERTAGSVVATISDTARSSTCCDVEIEVGARVSIGRPGIAPDR